MLTQLPLKHWLVILSAFISIAGAFAYVRDTLLGRSQPNQISWFIWAVGPLVGAFAAVAAGADLWAVSRIFLAGLLPLLVFLASFFNPKSFWKLTIFDFVCGLLSVLALIVWGAVQSPQLAILFAAAGDGFACLPTLVKAWRYPESETGTTYIAAFISVVLILPSIPEWNIENAAFPIYLLLASSSLIIAVYRRRALELFWKCA